MVFNLFSCGPINCFSTEDLDVLPDEADPTMQGLERFEMLMPSLGLSERKPIPDAISFPEPDPLGACYVMSRNREQDIAASISKL